MNRNLQIWNISETEFPRNASIAQQLEFCVNYAVMAQSTYNTQPWYFTIENNTISMFADRRYALPVVDPEDRQLIMSCASALFNLRLAIRYFGHEEYTQLLPNPAEEDLLARIQIGEGSSQISDEEKALFKAITRRRLNRSAFEEKDVPKEKLEALKTAAKKEGAWLYICEGDERDIVSHFIAEGDQMQMSNKAFRRELVAWTNERRFISGDGYPDYARGFREMMKSPKPRILRRFEMEPGKVVPDDQIADGCPVLAILGSEKGGTVDRLYAGQAFMRVLLQAETEGLSVSTLNQPCEVPELRLRLHDEIEHNHGRAQFILRIGYGPRPVNYSPRRPLSSFLEYEGNRQSYSSTAPANDESGQPRETIWGKFQKLFLANH